MFIKEAESQFTPLLLLYVIPALITRVDKVQHLLSQPTILKKSTISVFFTTQVSTAKLTATQCLSRSCK